MTDDQVMTDGGVATAESGSNGDSSSGGSFGYLDGWRIALYAVLAVITIYFLVPI